MSVEHDSYIKGAFKGWTGRGTYELEDGSAWAQVEYLYQYQHLHRPEAKVLSEGGRHFLQVEGMDERIEVRRVSRSP